MNFCVRHVSLARGFYHDCGVFATVILGPPFIFLGRAVFCQRREQIQIFHFDAGSLNITPQALRYPPRYLSSPSAGTPLFLTNQIPFTTSHALRIRLLFQPTAAAADAEVKQQAYVAPKKENLPIHCPFTRTMMDNLSLPTHTVAAGLCAYRSVKVIGCRFSLLLLLAARPSFGSHDDILSHTHNVAHRMPAVSFAHSASSSPNGCSAVLLY